MTEYLPDPIDTSRVTIHEDLAPLIEYLAANAHQIWAQERIRDGWKWGEKRDDARLEHPCLVPYEQLPDTEKHYDRVMVEQAIKAMIALGYRIDRAL